MTEPSLPLWSIGHVESSLRALDAAPKQADEGAPEALLRIDPAYAAAFADLRPGEAVLVLTWLDRADRSVLRVHPRDDRERPVVGVFSTRSSHRPNPIGVHRAEVVAVEPAGVRVSQLEAIDGTPVLDVKPALDADER